MLIRAHEQEQRVFPGIRFNCSGAITKWRVGAQIRHSADTTQYPELQIWREQAGVEGTFDRISHSALTELSSTDDLNVYEHVPSTPLQFQPGDVLGVYQPAVADSKVVLYNQFGGGTQNYRQASQIMGNFQTLPSNEGDKDVPLVSIETDLAGKASIVCAMEIIRCYVGPSRPIYRL